MIPSDSNTSLVPIQSSALAIRGSASLAKRGLGELQSLESAEAWFEKAMKAKSEERFEECFEYLQRVVALDPQHAEAAFGIGDAYYSGYGVPQEYAQAAMWFRKAADQGHATGQWYLSLLYFNGQSLPRDENQAIRWSRRAAENGNQFAQKYLGWRFNVGRGVTQDYIQAAFWYRKAAEQDNADAQMDLGLLYNLGHGVPRDKVEAWFWFYISAGRTSGPHPPTNKTFEDQAKEKLTNDERAEIEKRVKRWLETHPRHK